MLDCTGKEIKVGDKVLSCRSGGTNSTLAWGNVVSVDEKSCVYDSKSVGKEVSYGDKKAGDRIRVTVSHRVMIVEPASIDLGSIPPVKFPSAEEWWSGERDYQEIEERFPDHEPWDFAYALVYNDRGPLDSAQLVNLVCVQVGRNDEESWIWHVSLDDGTRWALEGWCDYTGWDCQSGVSWTQIS